jgi:glycosyltransferase involved in cell wall biosynthesis
VLDGAYENVELIVVDDASGDATSDVISQFQDPRLRYLRMPHNGGVLRARNQGFDLARGDYIVTLDDDDELVADALAIVAREFEKSAADNVHVLWFDSRDAESGQQSGRMTSPGGVIRFEEYVCGGIQGDFWLTFSREALRGYRFDEDLRGQESLLWLRIHRRHKARHVAQVLCLKYREHGGPRLCHWNVRMAQLRYMATALARLQDEFGEDMKRSCPMVYGKRLTYLGLHQMASGDFASGRRSVLRSLKYRPTLKYVALYLSSFLLSARQVGAIILRMDS